MATLTQRTSQDIQSRATQLPVQVTRTQAMASKMWAPFIAMGFMIVMAAFVYGLSTRPYRQTTSSSLKRPGRQWWPDRT